MPTCVCGYDLRGIPVDGRCPECGRAIASVADQVRRALRRWRARARVGGALVAAAWLLWAGVFVRLVVRHGPEYVVWGLDGPTPSSFLPWQWVDTLSSDWWAAKSAKVVALVGLLLTTRRPPKPLRTWPTSITAGLIALAGSWFLLATLFGAVDDVTEAKFGTILLAWTVSLPLVRDVSALSAYGTVIRYGDVAWWASVALCLAVTAAAHGRLLLGLRAACVAVTAGACGELARTGVFGQTDGDKVALALFTRYEVVNAALCTAGFVVVARLGWMSFWSTDCRATDGCGPAADGV